MTLRETFQTVNEAAIDSKLFKLQALTLKKDKNIVDYSSRLVELIIEMDGVGHSVIMMEQKRALPYGLPKEYNVTVEAITAMEHTYNQTVVKPIVRKTRMQDSEESNEQALVTMTNQEKRNCFSWGKIGQFL